MNSTVVLVNAVDVGAGSAHELLEVDSTGNTLARSGVLVASGTLEVAAGKGLDTQSAGALVLGGANATSVVALGATAEVGALAIGRDGTDEPNLVLSTTEAGYHFRINTTHRTDSGVIDHVTHFGFGILPTGGPEKVDGGGLATVAAAAWAVETRFNTGLGFNQSEFYPVVIHIGESAQTRPFYLTWNHTDKSGTCAWLNVVQSLVTNNAPFLVQGNHAGDNTIEIVRVNAADEIEIGHDLAAMRVKGDATVEGALTVTTAGSSTKRVSVTSASLAISPTAGVVLQSTTAATGGTPVQEPPTLMSRGTAWDTAASKYVGMRTRYQPQSAATPYGSWIWEDAVSASSDDTTWTFTQRALLLGGANPELRLGTLRAVGYDGANNLYCGASGATAVYVWGTTVYLYPGSNKLAANSTGLGFQGATPVAKQTSGANLTNSVTSGGTDDTITNWTDLTTYATDAAAIRNAVYQLARKVKQLNDGLRTYGLFT